MNLYNFSGILTGLLFLCLAIGLTADHPMAFVNFPGLLIVIGGTFTAIVVSVPVKEALAAFKHARILTNPVEVDFEQDIERIVGFAKLWFRRQVGQIDKQLEALDDPFMQRGLQMVRDQQSYEDIMAVLNWKIAQHRAQKTAIINIFRSMASYAPAFGMVGSLVGLVNMLQGVDDGAIASITADMAIALITTFYGLLLSNLLFKPIAVKLEQSRQLTTIKLSMIAEGLAMLQQNRTPSAIHDTLKSFLQDQKINTNSPQRAVSEITDRYHTKAA